MDDLRFCVYLPSKQVITIVMAALVARVNPDNPETLWKKYGAKFAGDVQNKRVLNGLESVA